MARSTDQGRWRARPTRGDGALDRPGEMAELDRPGETARSTGQGRRRARPDVYANDLMTQMLL